MISVSLTNVGAYTWYMEGSGDASLTTDYGFPQSTISEYNGTGHSLLLGVIANVYASATARGSMWVEAVATASEWVTASMYWYLRGDLGGGGYGFYGAYITVKFGVYDRTTQSSFDTVLLDQNLVWGDYGTWRLNTTDVPLYNAHIYVFSLDVEVHAHSEGLSAVVADFGGIWWEDSKIEWGYLDVPNTRILGGGGGGGCPYVYAWNGTQYVLDNNILPAAEMSNEADVEDYYKLEQPLIPTYQDTTSSIYSMRISEFEHEHSYLDQMKLFAVDYPPDVNVAVSPYGEILTYGNPASPITAVDEDGIDVLSQLDSIDKNYYQGYNGSHITLTFAPTDVSNGAKLVIRDDERPPVVKCPVYVQVLNETGEWNTVATFHTRTYWATDIINMTGYLPDPQGNLKVRLYFVSNDKIDYIGLDTTPQADIRVRQAFLLLAFHSTQGNVRPLLVGNDQTYAELVPDERIQLAFLLPNNQNEERTFTLYTKGHYNTIP